jgi:hypothetical protein
MRFSIRDLLWATALVAMGLSWWLDNQTRYATIRQAHRLRAALVAAKADLDLVEKLSPSLLDQNTADWSILDEPLFEP